MGLPLSTPGICAQIELGLKPFRQLLYEHQLKFYARVLKLDSSRWVKQALLDHQSLSWASPYISHIHAVKVKLGLFEQPLSDSRLLAFTDRYFVSATNRALAALSLPWIAPIKSFKRKQYVQESKFSTTLAQFRYDMPPIGHKYARVGRLSVQRHCPLCPCTVANSVSHLILFCPYIERIREDETSIGSFRNTCLLKEEKTLSLYINGFDWNENPVGPADFLDRGRELSHLLDKWLDKW